MRKNYIDERREDATSEWIARSAKIISQLHNEVEDVYDAWGGMSPKEIKDYLKKLPSWEAESEKGYAVGNFHCCMELHAGPLHHRLFKGLPLPENKEKEEEDYIYGGGFDFLDREDVEFLNNNGYIVVDGPRGPECLIKDDGLLEEVIGKSVKEAKYDDIFVGKLTEEFDLWVKAGGNCLVVKKEGNYLWPSVFYKNNICSTMELNASIEEMFRVVTTIEKEFVVTKDGECFPKK